MDILKIAALVVVGLIVLFLVYKFITGCLPKILLGIVILAVALYLAYRFFILRA